MCHKLKIKSFIWTNICIYSGFVSTARFLYKLLILSRQVNFEIQRAPTSLHICIQGGLQKKYFSLFHKTIPEIFWTWIVRTKIKNVAKSYANVCDYTKKSITVVFIIGPKSGPHSKKKSQTKNFKNMAISLALSMEKIVAENRKSKWYSLDYSGF